MEDSVMLGVGDYMGRTGDSTSTKVKRSGDFSHRTMPGDDMMSQRGVGTGTD
jgi:hypothetical protein